MLEHDANSATFKGPACNLPAKRQYCDEETKASDGKSGYVHDRNLADASDATDQNPLPRIERA